jgi:hypothetical protein
MRYHCIILFICLLIHDSVADEYTKLESMMSEASFDNISILLENDQIIITFENETFRNDHDAIYQVLKFVRRCGLKHSQIIIILQTNSIPLITVKYNLQDILQNRSETNVPVTTIYGSNKYWHSIQNRKKKNSGALKVDVVLEPLLNTKFGAFNNPIKKQIGFYTGFEFAIKNRLQLKSKWKFLLNNEFNEEEKISSPGAIYASYWMLIWDHAICLTNLGYFSQNQYGLNVNIKTISKSGKQDVTLIFGYTGLAYHDNNSWYYSNLSQLSYLLGFHYHFNNINADIRLFTGRFVSNDLGVRLEFLRNFGEVNMGYFVSKTELGRNGGIMLSIPIFPHKYNRYNKVTLRPAKYFDWTYNYKALQQSGIYFKEAFIIDEINKRLLPGSFNEN